MSIRIGPECSMSGTGETMSDATIYTIGHSNQTVENLVGLLRQHGVELVADVRSSPSSRYNPQFNREQLAAALRENGIEYAFHGDSLGGRPSDPGCYDGNEINYASVREKDWFREGLACVCREAATRVIVLLCAEENPNKCHRQKLLAPELLKEGATVIHIRGDGSLEEATGKQEQLRLL